VLRPATKARMARLLQDGLQTRSDLELDLGRHVALAAASEAPTEKPHP
jgi:hypothetical protein